MKIYLKTLFLLLILGFSGCKNGNEAKHSSDTLISTKWILLGLQNTDNKTFEPVPGELKGMNIAFDNLHRFQAASSCNTLYGYYLIQEQNIIKIDSLIMTKMFCMDSIQMTWEDRYISVLKSSAGYVITNDTLSISNGSKIDMIFKAETKKN